MGFDGGAVAFANDFIHPNSVIVAVYHDNRAPAANKAKPTHEKIVGPNLIRSAT